MKKIFIAIMLAFFLTTTAYAAKVPKKDYPKNTKFEYFATEANYDVDCGWGFYCPNGALTNPITHTKSQDSLNRVSGWGEYGYTQKIDTYFGLHVSQYSTEADAILAFGDFNQTLIAQTYKTLTIPAFGTTSVAYKFRIDTKNAIMFGAYQVGTEEVEFGAVYPTKYKKQVMKYLLKQVSSTT